MVILRYEKDYDEVWALVQVFAPGKEASLLIKKRNLQDIGIIPRGGVTTVELYGLALYACYEDVKGLRVGDVQPELKTKLDCSKRASKIEPAIKGMSTILINVSLIATNNIGGIATLEFKTKKGSIRFSRYEPERCCAHLF